MASSTADVLVVGGGFAGLAVATRLHDAGADVVVLEATDRPGGKLLEGTIGGCSLDVGAEAWLDRDAAMRELVGAAGLTGKVIATSASGVWLWGARGLHRMPRIGVMGVPLHPRGLVGALGVRGAARAAVERWLPHGGHDSDVSVGEFVDRRFGRAVTTELVDPLLGGVHAGHAHELSLRATVPTLADVPRGASVTSTLRADRPMAPAFLTIDGGLHRLSTALATRLGDRLQLGVDVQRLERSDVGWTVAGLDRTLRAGHVVLACPAPAVARLVGAHDQDARDLAASIDHASVGVVVLAYPAESAWTLPEGTGMLVSRTAGRFIKAATWVSQKWGRPLGVEPLLVRASVGRIDDARHLALSDEAVVERAVADLDAAVRLGTPVDAAVQRWDNALPQYRVGHLDRVATLRHALASSMPNVHLIGAAWDGVGLGPLASASAELAHDLRN